VGATLVIYYLYPRTPSVNQDAANVQIVQFNLTNNAVSFQTTVILAITNPNYVNLYLNSVTLNCKYEGIILGTLQFSNVYVNSQSVSGIPISQRILSTNSTVTSTMMAQFQTFGKIVIEFNGPIYLQYLQYNYNSVLDYAVPVLTPT